MNPLESGEMFDLALFNPNPSSSKTKDGPKYRVSFEVEREVWDLFMAAKTEGMIVACKAMATVDGQFKEPEKDNPGGQIAKALKLAGFFVSPKVAGALGTEELFRGWARQQPCAVCGGGDYDQDTGKRQCQFAHINRVELGHGTAIKSPWMGIPLCREHHQTQHDHGESAIVGGVSLIPPGTDLATLAHQYRERWAWQQFKAVYGLDSMREVSLEMIREFAAKWDLSYLLPKEVRDGTE
jgi:hypothetical protein